MTFIEQLTSEFPIRRTQKQKEAFREWFIAWARAQGYAAQATTPRGSGQSTNLIIGDVQGAQVVFTAHYDTPAASFLPNVMSPRSKLFYIAYQALQVAILIALGVSVGVPLAAVTGDDGIGLFAGYAVYMGLLFLMLFGPANRHNVNDNTSGVAALMEAMADIPEDARDKVAFILFDNMEKGRKGSKAYAAEHQQMQYTAFVVNLDSVGVGDTFVAAVPSLVRQLPQYERLTDILHRGGRDVRFHSAATTRSNSDFRSFKCGVGITAYRQVSGVGLYLGDLHTARDTHADEANIAFLAQALSALAAECASAADASADSSAEG